MSFFLRHLVPYISTNNSDEPPPGGGYAMASFSDVEPGEASRGSGIFPATADEYVDTSTSVIAKARGFRKYNKWYNAVGETIRRRGVVRGVRDGFRIGGILESELVRVGHLSESAQLDDHVLAFRDEIIANHYLDTGKYDLKLDLNIDSIDPVSYTHLRAHET